MILREEIKMKRLTAFLAAIQALLLPTAYAVAALADEVDYPETTPDRISAWPFILGGGALVVVAAALFLIIAAHRKKKS